MVNAAQRSLFGAVAAGPLTRCALAPPGVRTPQRGRGATARVELALPAGGAGRSKLRFRFRPLHRHCAPVSGDGRPTWCVACELLVEYAAAVGGFRLVRDRVVRVWADLLSDFTPQEVRWAIGAKAASIQADTPDAGVRRPGLVGADRSAHWRQLSDTRRAAAMMATRRLFIDRCEAWGFDPNDDEAAAVRLGFAADFACRQWPPAWSDDLGLEAVRS